MESTLNSVQQKLLDGNSRLEVIRNGLASQSSVHVSFEERLRSLESLCSQLGDKHTTLSKEVIGYSSTQAKLIDDIARAQRTREQDMQVMRQSIQEVRDRTTTTQAMQGLRQSMQEMKSSHIDLINKERVAREACEQKTNEHIEIICKALKKHATLEERLQHAESLLLDVNNKHASLSNDFTGYSKVQQTIIDSVSREQRSREADVNSLRDLVAGNRDTWTNERSARQLELAQYASTHASITTRMNHFEHHLSDLGEKYTTLSDDVAAFISTAKQNHADGMYQEQRSREATVSSLRDLVANYHSSVDDVFKKERSAREDYERNAQGHLEAVRQELEQMKQFVDTTNFRFNSAEEKCGLLTRALHEMDAKVAQLDRQLLEQKKTERHDVGQMIDVFSSGARQIEAIAYGAKMSSPSAMTAIPKPTRLSAPISSAPISPATPRIMSPGLQRPLASSQSQYMSAPSSPQNSSRRSLSAGGGGGVRTYGGGGTVGVGGSMFDKLDTNHDGVITRSEFAAGMR